MQRPKNNLWDRKLIRLVFVSAVNRDWRSKLVRLAAGNAGVSAQRSQDSQLREEEAAVRRGLEDRDRARLEQHSRDHLHGAARHRDRPQRRRDREDDRRDLEDGAGQTDQDRHPGNQDAGARRPARGGKRGAADRAPDCLSPRDEEGGAGGDGFRRAGNSVAQLGPLERRGNFALGMVSRRQSAAAHAAHSDRLRICGSEHGLRQDRREMLAV